MIYACILNGVVENTIVADPEFVERIASQWDHVIRIDQLDPQPGMGWLYDGEVFTNPFAPEEP